MLDKITIRGVPGSEEGVSAGSLAEILLFYGSVHLILDYGRLIGLLKIIGPENLDFLLDSGFLKVTYSLSQSGVHTNKSGPLEVHGFVEFQLGGFEKRKPTAEMQIALAYDRALPDFPRRGYYAKRFINKSKEIQGLNKSIGGGDASELVRNSISDDKYLNAAMRIILAKLLPSMELPHEMVFNAFQVGDGFVLGSNINFDYLNREYHKRIPIEHSSITRAYLLDFVWQSTLDLNLAARYGSELLTNQISAELIEVKVGNILQKVRSDAETIEAFSSFALKEGRSIKEAINSGRKNFTEFRDVLIKAKKFREWLDGLNPDVDLLKEYHDSCIKETWVDKLPAKSFRFGVFSAAGLALDLAFPTGIGTALGLGLAGTDSFILDRMIKGWKPNHFIDGVVGDFLLPKTK